MDDFANQVEQDRNDAIDELTKGEEVGNAPPEKDPVRLATGDFYWNKIDIMYQYINTSIKIQRSYQTQILSSRSFGKGWNFNYDTGIIHGVKIKAEEEVLLLKQIVYEVTQIYDSAFLTYIYSSFELILIFTLRAKEIANVQ